MIRTTPVLLLTHETMEPWLLRRASATAVSATTRKKIRAVRLAHLLLLEAGRRSCASSIVLRTSVRESLDPDRESL
jgi:hypothetical protein